MKQYIVVLMTLWAQTLQAQEPEIFLPGLVSTGYNERDMAISPDGTEMFYTVQSPRNSISVILRRIRQGNALSEAELAPFSGQYADLEPAFTPDGKKLFFVSNRPLSGSGKAKDYDIWFVEKTAAGWSSPIHTGNQINSARDEYYPSLTHDGSIYFTAERQDARGKEDIYRSSWNVNHFEAPVNIGGGVNSPQDEFNAFVDPDERYILFGIEGGEGDLGRGDLYISFREKDGTWSKAKNLGTGINSNRLDYCPYVYNGFLYFTSERPLPVQEGVSKSLDEIKKSLNSWGNGWGDIYRTPLQPIIQR